MAVEKTAILSANLTKAITRDDASPWFDDQRVLKLHNLLRQFPFGRWDCYFDTIFRQAIGFRRQGIPSKDFVGADSAAITRDP